MFRYLRESLLQESPASGNLATYCEGLKARRRHAEDSGFLKLKS
jgi:hypothetical protein